MKKLITKEEFEKEIESLEKTVNRVGHKYGGGLLMKVASLKKQLFSMGKI